MNDMLSSVDMNSVIQASANAALIQAVAKNSPMPTGIAAVNDAAATVTISSKARQLSNS
ncbi:MAG: hypothetical protein KC476_01380 [Cyanobacteria bacterium HKST-UBA06]|nr:hypothetical protein [Cyanobacteria bacterium HKST-UBA06]